MLDKALLQAKLQETLKAAEQAQSQAREWANRAITLQGCIVTLQELLKVEEAATKQPPAADSTPKRTKK
jgi:hypothetical protein